MQAYSIFAIYILFWVLSAFIVLPFGIKNHYETGQPLIPGQDTGAPANYRPLRVIIYTTLLATVTFLLFYFNYINEWITLDDIDFFRKITRY